MTGPASRARRTRTRQDILARAQVRDDADRRRPPALRCSALASRSLLTLQAPTANCLHWVPAPTAAVGIGTWSARDEAVAVNGQVATMYEELIAERSRVLGPDNHNALEGRATLARLLGDVSDSAAAASSFAALLADRMRVLGPDHPSTRTTSSNLAYWLAMAASRATVR